MKFLLFAVVSLLLVGLLAIGFFDLYDQPFKAQTETNKKPNIEFIDKKDLRIESTKCTNLDTEIQTIIDSPQTCISDKDCSQLKFNGSIQLNMLNYQKAKNLSYKKNQQCPSLVQEIIVSSPPAENYIHSHAECINSLCTSVLNLSPKTEIQKLLKQ